MPAESTSGPDPSATERLARRFFERLYGEDPSAAVEMLTEDAQWWLAGILPASGLHVGSDAIATEFLPIFAPVWEGNAMQYRLRNLLVVENQAVAEIEAGGTTAHGNRYQNFYCYVLTVRAGKIAMVRAYTDTGYALGVLWGPQRAAPPFC